MNDYPPDWKEIAAAIKEKNGWRCERCAHPHRQMYGFRICDDRCTHKPDGKQRVLTVHHLDGDKANCADWNLAALCQVCHLQVQGRVNMRQGWLFEHSGWMIPHVNGMEIDYAR